MNIFLERVDNEENYEQEMHGSLTISPWTNGLHFFMHFHEWKVLYFDLNFNEVCSLGSNWQ